jgi:arabinoxylan arabinofuranohydrolase
MAERSVPFAGRRHATGSRGDKQSMSTNRKLGMMARRALLLGILSVLPTPARADNPIVQTNYTADPAPLVHEGKLYVYTSHDEDVTVNNFYTMNDWRLYSTEDMVNWTDHGSPAGLRSFSWGTDSAWAPHGIARNGQFYLYVPLNNNTGGRIGVGVSDNVAGPFTDPLGRDLAQSPSSDIDPSVFIDDDGQAYMYWGNATLNYVRLNEDMISYSGAPTAVALPGFTEGPWFYKRQSLYYMIYAGMGGATEKISYATSDSPTGPWNTRGDIMGSGSTFTNHAGVVDYKGHSYFFYHNSALPGGNDFKRSVCVEEFSYAADGSIPQLTMSANGPDAIATLNPFEQVEAETIAFSSGLKTEACDDTGAGLNVTQISAGDYIKVKNVDFLDGVTSFEARVSSSGSGASIELHLDSPSGTLLGTCDVSGASSWTTTTCPVSGGSGTHDLFLVFAGSGDELFKFNWWKFSGPTLPTDDGGTGDTSGVIGPAGSSPEGSGAPGSGAGTEGSGVGGGTASGGSGAGDAAMSGSSAGSDSAGSGQRSDAVASGSESQGGSCRVGPRHTRDGGSVALGLAAACALSLARRRRDARGRLSAA